MCLFKIFTPNFFLQDLQEHVSAYLEGQKKDSREISLEKHVKVSLWGQLCHVQFPRDLTLEEVSILSFYLVVSAT